MKKTILAIACLAVIAGTTTMCTKKQENPFLAEYTTKYEIPPFEQIKPEHYLQAMKAGFDEQNANIQAIIDNQEGPTFANTILAMENSSPILDRVSAVLNALSESNSDDNFVAICDEFYPAYSQHSDEIMMNEKLFGRVQDLYFSRDTLQSPIDKRLVEKYYKMFTRSGANLPADKKEELKAVNTELQTLYLKFNNNLLDATKAFEIVIDDESRLAGLPAIVVETAAETAAAKGMEGKWVFTLHAPSRLPVLTYADDRDLREQMWKGYTSLASEGEYSNYPVINKILQARAKKAAILGYENFGAYQTENVMAGTVENAENLLMQIWGPAKARVAQEVAEMNALAGFEIEPWDYYYYAEKTRKLKYDLDESEVSQYFAVDSVRNGIFTMAETLYGVKFTKMEDAPKYYSEVDVYDVTDAATGEHVAVFMTDYFTRPEKRQGAWMSEFKGEWVEPDGTSSRPIIFNVGNFTRPTANTPSLLTIDEVETMFHEFGHGLHGMLTRAPYKSLSGTNVDRDFVELPSQIHEHWAFTPEMLNIYAHHYQTGDTIPAALVEKLQAASTHNQGFMTTELCGAALLDLQYAKLNPTEDIDIAAFEEQVSEQLGLPKQLTYRYRSPYFKHIFGSDGYSSGYYTYLWAEVLDCDGFELFEQNGIFDPATAKSFKENVLEQGDSDDPMALYIRFRGQEPKVDALLRNRGLK